MNSVILTDWNWIRVFLAVCERGSLSAAARELGMSQPTLSRHIQQMEHKTGLNLFKRTTQGLTPTIAAQNLLAPCQQMQQLAHGLEREISGQNQTLQGNIRISANELVGMYLLPAAITQFQNMHPQVSLELLIDNEVSNLNKREADLALRMFRPTQADLVVKRLPNLPLAMFGEENYLNKYGTPESVQDLLDHKLIGFDEVSSYVDLAQARDWPLKRDSFVVRTDNLLTQIALLKSGAGLVVTHKALGDALPNIRQVLPKIDIPELEFWLVCHSDVHYNRAIREFMLFLGKWFQDDPYAHSQF